MRPRLNGLGLILRVFMPEVFMKFCLHSRGLHDRVINADKDIPGR